MTSVFLPAYTDYAFKRIFGSEGSEDILIAFLNAILRREGDDRIVSLEILDPNAQAPASGLKDSILDVEARLHDGTKVLIEMQVAHHRGYHERLQYNVAKDIAEQLQRGQSYTALTPVIGVSISMFDACDPVEHPHYLNHFIMSHEETGKPHEHSLTKLVYVELNKFPYGIDDIDKISSLEDKWLYFLKHSGDLQTVPPVLDQDVTFHHAFDIANYIGLNEIERKRIDKMKEFYLVRYAELTTNYDKGLREGREQGIEQGIEKGIEQMVQTLMKTQGVSEQEARSMLGV